MNMYKFVKSLYGHDVGSVRTYAQISGMFTARWALGAMVGTPAAGAIADHLSFEWSITLSAILHTILVSDLCENKIHLWSKFHWIMVIYECLAARKTGFAFFICTSSSKLLSSTKVYLIRWANPLTFLPHAAENFFCMTKRG